MKCAKCGAELKVGCIYCSVCGQEAQIVPDYNILEDDLLKNLLTDEEKRKKQAETKATAKSSVEGKKQIEEKKQAPPKKKKKSKIPVIAASMASVVLLVILVVLLIRNNQNNSYDYQMNKAESYIQEKEYDRAQKYLEQAVKLEKDSVEAWLLLADIYMEQDAEDDAIDALKKVIAIDKENEEAYEKLISIYAELKEYDDIAKLSEQVEDSNIMDLFSDYLVTAPVIENKEYDQEKGLEVISQSGTTTYYTVNGSDPKKGEEYKEPIFLKEGTTTIRLISVNELGIYSEEAEYTFELKYEPPEAPVVSPNGGNFNLPQQITIRVPAGCTAYYTWDGSDPTAGSEQYTAPLEMPEGNNILSVVLVDEHGLWSDVTKCNFIYIP